MQISNGRIFNPQLNEWVPMDHNPNPLMERIKNISTAAAKDPEGINKVGFARQFFYGTVSPIHSGLARVGAVERRPEPQSTAEHIAFGLGSVLGYGAFLTPLGRISGTAAKAIIPTLAAKSLARRTTEMAITGSMFGAYQSWAEERPFAKTVLSEAALFGAFPAIGAGVSSLARKTGLTNKFKEQIQRLSIPDPNVPRTSQDVAAIGERISLLPAKKVSEAKDALLRRVAKNEGLPSDVSKTDWGVRFGSTFNQMTPDKQVTTIMDALKNTRGADTLFQPIIKAVNIGDYGKEIFKSKGRAKKVYTDIMKRAKPTVLGQVDGKDVTIPVIKGVKFDAKANNLYDQYTAVKGMQAQIKSSRDKFLKKHGWNNMEEAMQIAHDPKKAATPLHGNTIKAIKKYSEANSQLQDYTWQLQSALAEAAGVASPRQLGSAVLAKAHSEAPMRPEINFLWEPGLSRANIATIEKAIAATKDPKRKADLEELLKGENLQALTEGMKDQINKRFGYSAIIDSVSDLRGLKGAMPELTEQFLKRHKLLRELKIPTKYAQESAFTVPVPITATTKRPLAKLEEKQMHEFMKIKPTSEHIGPATLAEEYMLRSAPAPLTEFLMPIRHYFGDTFTNSLRGVVQKDKKFRATFLGQVNKWKKDLGLKDKELSEAGNRIFSFLENPDVPTKEFFSAAKRGINNQAFKDFAKKWGLSPKELEIAYGGRLAFEKIFKQSGLDYGKYIKHYAPRFKKMNHKNYDDIHADLVRRGLDEKEIKKVFWVNDMPRKGTLNEYDTDFFRVLPKYVSGASKRIHYEDYFAHWTSTFYKKGVLDPSRKKTYESLQNSILDRPTRAERQVDTYVNNLVGMFKKEGLKGARPTAAASAFLAELQYMGGLGLNPWTAVKNLTQKGLLFSELSDKGNWIEGMTNWYRWKQLQRTSFGKVAQSWNAHRTDRMFMEGLELGDSAITNFMRRIGVSPEGAKKMREGPFKMFRWSDLDNVDDAFGAQFMRMVEKGAPMQEAADIAMGTVRATQFMYGLDSPMLYKGPFGRQMGIFMSWPLNWASLLWQQGSRGDMKTAVSMVGMMAIGSEALSLTGYNFGSIHPMSTARGVLPIAMAEGEERWPIALRSGAAGIEALRALASGDPDAITRSFDTLKHRARPLVPMGVMGGRVLDFIDLAKNDWKKYDSRDRFRYEMDPMDAFQAALGPTMEANQRWNDWNQVQDMTAAYRRLRKDAVDAYVDGNYDRFERLQQQLMVNFGRWIEAKDIEQEMQLKELTSLERQMTGLPSEVKDPFLQSRGIFPEEEDILTRIMGMTGGRR